MARRIGYAVSLLSLIGAVVYIYLVWFTDLWIILTKITLSVVALVGFGAVAWFSYALARSKPPKPVTQIEYVVESEMGGAGEREENHDRIYQ